MSFSNLMLSVTEQESCLPLAVQRHLFADFLDLT